MSRPDKRHEFKLKRIAFHAKMHSGQCVGRTVLFGLVPAQFPAYFLRLGICKHIKTLENSMSHKGLASTMVYLKGSEQRRYGPS
jgi:hypothetical protein